MLKLEIDREKCQIPFDCKKCIVECPQMVFTVGAVKVEKFKETDPKEPGTYHLNAFYMDKCSGCGDCVAVCPEEAIKITTED
jgi:NADH-quinone oxidoreductase subunit I